MRYYIYEVSTWYVVIDTQEKRRKIEEFKINGTVMPGNMMWDKIGKVDIRRAKQRYEGKIDNAVDYKIDNILIKHFIDKDYEIYNELVVCGNEYNECIEKLKEYDYSMNIPAF